jgi:hypothetical protein
MVQNILQRTQIPETIPKANIQTKDRPKNVNYLELDWLIDKVYIEQFLSRKEVEQLRGPEGTVILRRKQSEEGLAVSTLRTSKHFNVSQDKQEQLLTNLCCTPEFRYLRKGGLIYPMTWVKTLYSGAQTLKQIPNLEQYQQKLKDYYSKHRNDYTIKRLPEDFKMNNFDNTTTTREWIESIKEEGLNLRCLRVSVAPAIIFGALLRYLNLNIPISDLQNLIPFHPLDLIGTLSCFAEVFRMVITVVERANYWYELQEEKNITESEYIRPNFVWGVVLLDNRNCDMFVSEEYFEIFQQQIFFSERSFGA